MKSQQKISYRSTSIACYTGNFVQAIVVNLTPILFIPLKQQFGLSYQQLGLLILVNFVTQVLCDIAFSRAVDRYGFRPFATTAHLLTILGFLIFAGSPLILDKPYIGFLIGTIIFSGSGGLLELLLSPIVNAIPTDEKAAAMSVLHSFYAWGQVTVVLITTLFLFAFGRDHWQLIMVLWMIIPLINFFLFLKVPLAPPVPEEHRQGMRMLIGQPFFLFCFFAILFGGAAENIIAQWSSAYLEKAIHLPKLMGDVTGMCMFGLMLGIGRALHGKYGSRIDLSKLMVGGAVLAAVCYLVVALSPIPAFSVIACALCGLAVSLLWPGVLVLAAEKYPLAGSWMFAILAAGGDIGSSVGPWLVSLVADHAPKLTLIQAMMPAGQSVEQISLRIGMLVGALFPIIAFLCNKWISNARKKEAVRTSISQ